METYKNILNRVNNDMNLINLFNLFCLDGTNAITDYSSAISKIRYTEGFLFRGNSIVMFLGDDENMSKHSIPISAAKKHLLNGSEIPDDIMPNGKPSMTYWHYTKDIEKGAKELLKNAEDKMLLDRYAVSVNNRVVNYNILTKCIEALKLLNVKDFYISEFDDHPSIIVLSENVGVSRNPLISMKEKRDFFIIAKVNKSDSVLGNITGIKSAYELEKSGELTFVKLSEEEIQNRKFSVFNLCVTFSISFLDAVLLRTKGKTYVDCKTKDGKLIELFHPCSCQRYYISARYVSERTPRKYTRCPECGEYGHS